MEKNKLKADLKLNYNICYMYMRQGKPNSKMYNVPIAAIYAWILGQDLNSHFAIGLT